MPDQYGGSNGMVGPSYTGDGDSTNAYGKDQYNSDLSEGAQEGIMKGAQMGTQIFPGIGTAIGAVFGGLHGLLGGSAKAKAKRRAAQAREAAWNRAQKQLAQERYNSRVYATKNFQNSYSPANASLGDMYGKNRAFDLSKTPWSTGKEISEAERYPIIPASKPPSPAEAAAKPTKKQNLDRENETPARTKNGTKPQVK